MLWTYVCVITLGFPAKYLQRLELFIELVPKDDEGKDIPRWSTSPEFSDRGGKGKGSQRTMREKQQVSKRLFCRILLLTQVLCPRVQEEWDRLNIAVCLCPSCTLT